jgi:hypothetical protein
MPHIVQGIGNAIEPAIAHVARERPLECSLESQRATGGINQVEHGRFPTASIFIDAIQGERRRLTAQGAARGIRCPSCLAACNDLVPERLDRPHQGRPADLRTLPQGPDRDATPGFQDLQRGFRSRFHETIYEMILFVSRSYGKTALSFGI